MRGAADIDAGPGAGPALAANAGEPGTRGRWWDTALLIGALIVLWQVATLVLGRAALPSPLTTLGRLGAILADPDFPADAWETGRAFATALVLALAGGLAIGLALGAHRLSGEVAEPVLAAFYSIPKITLYPVILLLFGLGLPAKIAFGVIHGIVPVALFAMNAVRNIPRVHLRTARAMRLSAAQTAWSVMMPAALPEIVSGFRLGFALTLLGTLLGEMFASQRGLGYRLIHAMEVNDVDTVTALALLLVACATVAASLLLALDRRLHRRTLPDQG
jgi:NitT/TauT family transport system permease protein